jgi:hypothetical protein
MENSKLIHHMKDVLSRSQFKSFEDYAIFNFQEAQLKLLDQVKKYLSKHGKNDTLQFIAALMDSLK